MSLARAFTKRMKRDDTQTPARSGTVRYAAGTIKRDMISLPTELISTTNVQALTAPDLPSRSVSGSSSNDSVSSGNDSDFSTIDRGFLNGADDSSIDISSPSTPITPPMESSKDFFNTKPITAPSFLAPEPTPDTPAVPKRALSHSKKAHVELSRKRSIQRMTPPPDNLEKSLIRNSADMFSPQPEESHPFGRELAKVNEVAEDFGAGTAVLDEEEQELLTKGLCKFSVDEYINEIAGLYSGGVFENRLGTIANPWL